MELIDFKPKLSEHQEQASFFDSVMFKFLPHYPQLHPLLFSVPNGAHLAGGKKQRSMQVNKLKREGMTPGVVDVLLLSGHGGSFGLGIEFKTPDRQNEKNGGLSEPQLEFMRALKMEGFRAEVAYGAEHGEQILSDYLSKPSTQDLIYGALKALENGEVERAKEILQQVVLAW